MAAREGKEGEEKFPKIKTNAQKSPAGYALESGREAGDPLLRPPCPGLIQQKLMAGIQREMPTLQTKARWAPRPGR